MRTRIKVADMTLGQWDYLQDNLQEIYDIPDQAVSVYVEFELDPQIGSRFAEMPVRAFVALLRRLREVQAQAEAVLTPDAARSLGPLVSSFQIGAAELPAIPPKWSAPLSQPRTCDHGSPVVAETPSAFADGEPVRDYADGCQSVGPYRSLDT